MWGKVGKGDQRGDPGYGEVTSAIVTEWLFRGSLSQQIGQSSLHPEQGYQTTCGHSGERIWGGGRGTGSIQQRKHKSRTIWGNRKRET